MLLLERKYTGNERPRRWRLAGLIWSQQSATLKSLLDDNEIPRFSISRHTEIGLKFISQGFQVSVCFTLSLCSLAIFTALKKCLILFSREAIAGAINQQTRAILKGYLPVLLAMQALPGIRDVSFVFTRRTVRIDWLIEWLAFRNFYEFHVIFRLIGPLLNWHCFSINSSCWSINVGMTSWMLDCV